LHYLPSVGGLNLWCKSAPPRPRLWRLKGEPICERTQTRTGPQNMGICLLCIFYQFARPPGITAMTAIYIWIYIYIYLCTRICGIPNYWIIWLTARFSQIFPLRAVPIGRLCEHVWNSFDPGWKIEMLNENQADTTTSAISRAISRVSATWKRICADNDLNTYNR